MHIQFFKVYLLLSVAKRYSQTKFYDMHQTHQTTTLTWLGEKMKEKKREENGEFRFVGSDCT